MTVRYLIFLDSGYYMKFDTSSGPAGNSAILESRILYPKREEQCLQFFYKMNGSPRDKLVIWVRTDDGTGNIRNVKKIHTIMGTFFFQDLFCRLMAKFIFTNCHLSSTWPSPSSMTSSITKVPPAPSDLLPSSPPGLITRAWGGQGLLHCLPHPL